VLWRRTAPFKVAHPHPAGHAPRDHHPPGWGKLELHHYGELGPGRQRVVVHSTARRRDGWRYCVAELASYPGWAAWFLAPTNGTRIEHARSGDSLGDQLAQAFSLHQWGPHV